jgi:hyperosmotically inducible protein
MLLPASRMRPTVGPTLTRFGLGRRRSAAVSPLAIAAAAAACGMTLGALLAYFLDPKAGRRRRHTTRDRAMSRVRRGERRARLRARRAESHAVGIARRTLNAARPRDREPLDDVTLARKVESELYRRAHVPKGHISINAEDGFVFLRGVMDRQEDIERVAVATRQIDGVREVENLIHLPGTPAPASQPMSERLRAAGSVTTTGTGRRPGRSR